MKMYLFIITMLISTVAFSQSVNFSRKKLSSGVTGDVSLFIDGEYFCSLPNNSTITHTLSPGKHSFHIQWDGKQAKDQAVKDAVTLDLKADQDYFLKAIKEERGIKSVILLEELSASAGAKIISDTDKVDCKGN